MIKKTLLYSLILSLCFSLPALAKKDEFTLTGQQKFKPKNIKILTKAWSRGLKAGSPGKRYHPENSNPTGDGSTVYVGTHGNTFYAVNASDGKIMWKYKNNEPISSMASETADRVFFTDLGGGVICLNKSNGQQIWKREMDREMLGQPLLANGNLYILKGEQEIVALSQGDGHIVWNRFIRTYIKNITMRGQSSVVLDGHALYVGLADGHFYKLSASDGKILWDKNLNIPLRSFKDIDANVVIEGDSLYVGGYFGALYRIRKSNGSIVWGAEVATGVPVAVLGDIVIASDTNGTIYGFDKADGTQLWFNELNRSVLSAPVAFADKIFVSSYKRDAYLLNVENGNQVQKLSVGEGSINQPYVDGNQIIVLTNSAKLISLKAK